MAYYCTECEKMHRNLSGVGVRHKEYAGERPTRITVKPDRSHPNYTGISIEGNEIESWTGTNNEALVDASSEKESEKPWSFTLSLFEDIVAHVKQFPQVPFNYTPKKQDECRWAQQAWLRKLKDLLQME